jgi:hypothetical protein
MVMKRLLNAQLAFWLYEHDSSYLNVLVFSSKCFMGLCIFDHFGFLHAVVSEKIGQGIFNYKFPKS